MEAVAYKTSDHLKTKEDILHYIGSALEDGNTEVLFEALRNVAEAQGMAISRNVPNAKTVKAIQSTEFEIATMDDLRAISNEKAVKGD